MALNSQTGLINWNRYWYKDQSDLPLDHLGFVADPEERWAAVMYPNLVRLRAVRDTSCLVLLGEPGLGKSVTIQEHVRLVSSAKSHTVLYYDLKNFGGEFSLIRNLFDAEPLRSWSHGSDTLELYLDSLDEGLLNIEALAGLLVQELAKLECSRLRLRLACRPAVWPKSLERELQQLWPEDTKLYRLAPLTRADVELAAEHNGLPPSDFIEAIRRSSAISFARKPLTLKMLLQVYSETRGLPDSITDLYQRGIVALACESNDSRNEKLKTGALTPQQRVAVSERIASVSILCNRRVIDAHPAIGSHEEAELSGDNLYGRETFEGSDIAVNAAILREVLDTGLFRWRTVGNAEWDHLSYAEYLAASYLARHNVPIAKLKQLVMTTVDGQTRAAPQLKETAAWLAMMVPEFRAYMLRVDPLVLLGSDVTRLSPADRKGLAGALLALPDENLGNLNLGLGQLAVLGHAALAEQLLPYLTDHNQPAQLRRFVMEVIRDCHVNLDAELFGIATDESEVPPLRSHAAFVLAEIGQEATKKKLVKALASRADYDDEIKGWVLSAVWPDHLDPAVLFRHLTIPKNDHLTGSYRMFLYSLARSIHAQLPTSAVPIALTWVYGQHDEQFPDALSGIQDAIIIHAWNSLDANDNETAKSLARVIGKRIADFEPVLRGRDSGAHLKDFSQVISSDSGKRRILLRALVHEVANRPLDPTSLFRSSDRVLIDEDVAWLISELPSLPPVESDVVLRSLSAAPLRATVLDAISNGLRTRILPESFNTFLFVEFGSAEYTLQRSAYAQYLWYSSRNERRRNRKLNPAPSERIAHDLEQVEGGKPESWRALARDLSLTQAGTDQFIDEKPIIRLPGWLTADPTTQARILDAARVFVRNFQPRSEEFIGKSSFPDSLIAAYQALVLLADFDSKFLLAKDAAFWGKWLPFLLWYPFDTDGSGVALITLAVQKARSDLPSAVLLMTGADQHYVSRSIMKLESVWASDVEDTLASAIARDGLAAEWTRGAIEKLVSGRNEVVVQLLVAAAANDNGLALDQRVFAASTLIQYVPERIWDITWQGIESGDEEFGEKLIEALARGRNWNFFSQLTEGQLAELFIFTALHYPPSEDPQHKGAYSVTLRDEIADFRNAVPRHLASLGTPESIRQLSRARKAVPEADWLKYYEANARTNAHRFAWTPAEPADILTFSKWEESPSIANRKVDFLIAILLAVAPSLLPSNRFTFWEKLGSGAIIALTALVLFQLPNRRRSTWFPLVVILFLSALAMGITYFAFFRGN